ncbi:MAG: urea ABC transporter ATP-binding protein UrtD [Clostridiales bacterium]|nr:urea ABC transporter ATP-binding protein UrtD [Clostridiales bacterium]
MSRPILEAKGMYVDFNKFQAIADMNLTVYDGELRVIIGPNGAGKTTLMDLITGKTKPTKGRVIFDGHDITGKSPSEISLKYRIGRKFQGPNLFENMTAYQNIEVALHGYSSIGKTMFFRRTAEIEARVLEILELTGLAHERKVMASSLSHGQRQWLEMGMVIAQDPKLIILDEPTSGMTAEETAKTGRMIQAFAGDHTIIVVEHDMEFVKQISNVVTVMHQGTLLAEGTYAEIEKNPEVLQVYLKSGDGEEVASC